MRKILWLLLTAAVATAYGQGFSIVNSSGASLEIRGYDTYFNDCAIPDEHTSIMKQNDTYHLPIANVANFKLKRECKQQLMFLVTSPQSSSFLGYDPEKPLTDRLEYKLVAHNAYIFPSQDLYHRNSLVINIGSNGN